MYIYQQPDWPYFKWDQKELDPLLLDIQKKQAFLLGRMSALGFDIKMEATLEILTSDAVKSSQIEGELLEVSQVRSSVARRLGIDMGTTSPVNRYVEGMVDVILNATKHYDEPLTENRLFAWHKALFPTGQSGLRPIAVGKYRRHKMEPMQVLSGPHGREKIHFEAPPAKQLPTLMRDFLTWFNKAETDKKLDPFLKTGIAHLWFITLHPFEDGNGRLARIIADLCLARADKRTERFYSLSSYIEKHRKQYYELLESSQKGTMDITTWLKWFLTSVQAAIEDSDSILEKILFKAKLWQQLLKHSINARQRKILNLLCDDFYGKLTTSKYAKIAKCSSDTALRDIRILLDYGVLEQDSASGRSTAYHLIKGEKEKNED